MSVKRVVLATGKRCAVCGQALRQNLRVCFKSRSGREDVGGSRHAEGSIDAKMQVFAGSDTFALRQQLKKHIRDLPAAC